MAWGVRNNGWWGEGEMKFFLDGDGKFPTICTTGTEDYFCGSYNFENKEKRQYETFCTPYAGLHQIIRPDGLGNGVEIRKCNTNLESSNYLQQVHLARRLKIL